MQNVALQDRSIVLTFPEIEENNILYETFKNARVAYVNYFKKSSRFEVGLDLDTLVKYKEIVELQDYLAKCMKLEGIHIRPKFYTVLTLEKIIDEYWDSILYYTNTHIALSRGLMKNAIAKVEDKKLKIQLQTKGSSILSIRRCDNLIEKFMLEAFDITSKVIFLDADFSEKALDEYTSLKEEKQSKLVLATISANLPAPTEKKAAEPSATYETKQMPPDVILGKTFNDVNVELNTVTQDSGKVVIKGEIFKVEQREIRSGKILYMFDMTDLTSSITVKFFTEKEKLPPIADKLKEGAYIKVRGEAQYDKFSREMSIFASDIMELKKTIKMDTAEEKRVELHLHTQMSTMDAVTPVKELVKRAALWGHKAIAITDHGVVQAYPDAFDAAKKNKIKILYGVECYILDDSLPIAVTSKGQSLDSSYIVFDIETTGLSAENDKITEIGAVKVLNGEVVDTFSTFVNPEVHIPSKITQLTGITDEMVADAPKIEDILPEFLEFCEGSVLVAHNASFDVGFIRVNARRLNIDFEFTVLDTLQLARKMFPELKSHKLNIVANHLEVRLDNHHRAVDDSKATAEIFIKCCNLLKEQSVFDLDQLNGAFEGEFDYKKAQTYHAIILVKNTVGLKNLYKIVSESHLKYYHKRPRVPKKLLMDHKEGLIIGSACEAGELYSAILENKSFDEISKIVRFYDYLEIQPLGNNQFLVDNGKVRDIEGLMEINKKIVSLGEKYNKPVVATCDVHFIDPHDEAYRRILMAGKGFTDADKQAPLYFRTTTEMLDEFKYLGEGKAHEVVVKNTNLIADMIEEIAPVPSGVFPPKIEGAEEDIKSMSESKAKEIYGDPLPEIVEKRLEKELNSIIKNGFSVMYLIAQKLVCKSVNDGYLVGSRGSVGSSFVANMSGITEVNSLEPHYICTHCKYSEFITDGSYACGFDLPEKDCPKCGKPLKKDGYDIPFETFLGFDGDKEPDIDLNFSGEYQPRAHKYTEELFGEGHVFRAGTIASVADKTAFGYVKNYMDERGMIVTNAEMNRLVKGCTGIKRTTGQHPGGIMIVPQDKEIYDFSPIQRPADDPESTIITTHFDYHFLHGSILKLDILGHDDPTVIRMLQDLTGIDPTTIPIGESKTMSLFSSTEALGVTPDDINSEVGTFAIPEFGTKFVRQMLVDTRPTEFSELIRISGLSHGTDVWLNNAQDLIRDGICNLSESICCRDDIMIYLIHKGLPPKTAFKIMEDVRKGKGLKDEYIEIMKENNVPAWYIGSCQKIKYMFPKAHAAAYVMMAFRIAWFKVHYPEAFYVAYFTVRADDFDAKLMTHGQQKVKEAIKEYEQKGNTLTQKEKNILTILEVTNEMYARGINFLPVDLYNSDATRFQITPFGIRPPLNALQGLGTAAAQNIVESRKEGEFLSVDELKFRAKVSKSVIEILDDQGCLKDIPETNQLSLFNL